MLIESPKTITVDGKEHNVADFNETIQRLVDIHVLWRNQLQDERLAVAKTEAAIRGLDAELSQEVAKALNPPAEEAAAANDEPVKKTKKAKA